jgi:5-deoxy-glucuronate isomerase
VLPLSGACTVIAGDQTFSLHGREGVFASTTDFAYVPTATTVEIRSEHGGRFAIPSSRAQRHLAASYHPASHVEIGVRGAGACTRQVNGIAMDGFDADHLMVCEVLTPAGNWSSFPPHKHDEDRDGESALEEIYYFEVAGSHGEPGMAYQRVYGTDDRPIDVLAEVRSGDVVLVPHGWHGPSMAAPGHDLYYLNVMAGHQRSWQICDDPAHAWVRETWTQSDTDTRVPMTGHPGGSGA